MSAWWPAAATLVAFVASFSIMPTPRGGYDFGTPFLNTILFLLAAIVSLSAWLIWALAA